MSLTIVKSEVKESNIDGLGLFAKCDLLEGELVGFFDGQVRRFPVEGGRAIIPEDIDEQAIDLKIDNGWLYALVPFDRQCLSGVDYINHSCNPNCKVVGFLEIFTLRPIWAGEELTIDYSPLTLIPEGKQCKCEPHCERIL